PRSSVHPGNLARTCGSCHPGAGQRFAMGPVHVSAAGASEPFAVRLVRLAYLFLIPFSVAFMLVHNGADFLAKLRRGPLRETSAETVERMNRRFRIAHGLAMASFPLLVVTGFALKYPDAAWSAPLLALESRFAFRGLLHRGAGSVLIAALGYHAVHLARSSRD